MISNPQNKLLNVMKISSNNSEKRKMVKQLFEIDPENYMSKNNNKIKVNYNETVFFTPSTINKNDYSENTSDYPTQKIAGEENQINSFSQKNQKEQELTKIINNVINSTMSGSTDKPSIKVNLNINNNYYNSNYNYVVKMKANEKSPSTSVSDNNLIPNQRTSTMSSRVNHQTKNSMSSINSDYLPTRKSVYKEPNYNFLFIPCINCNNLVHVEEIEKHSNFCTRVRSEVMIAESSQFSCHTIDFKLKKLQEHINMISNSENLNLNINFQELNKDKHYISLLSQYIIDSINISKIENKSISELKKLLTNIDTLTTTFKGSMSTLILIERTRVLVHDKISVFKEDYKISVQTKKHNERKSGTINTLKIMQLEKEMLEKKKIVDKLENEKEMMLRKVSSLKKSPVKSRQRYLSPMREKLETEQDNFEPSEINSYRVFGDTEVDDDEEPIDAPRLDSNKIYNQKNVIEDINSDLEDQSVKSGEYSDCTSMTSTASVTSANNEMKNINFNDNYPETELKGPTTHYSSNQLPEYKKMYQEFVKLMLRVKFEKIHSSHKGQQISEKLLFKECIRQNIPQRNWMEFIVNELKNPTKYTQVSKRDGKNKNLKNFRSSVHNMEVINEEI